MRAAASILLLVERGDRVHEGLNKALLLARYFHTRLDIFLCDTEGYISSGRGARAPGMGASSCVTEGNEYVQALRKSVFAPDVEIVTEATCAPSLRDAVAERLQRRAVDLLVKTIDDNRRGSGGRPAAEWAAIAACPVPVLLTRGRPWRPVGRFGALEQLGAPALESNRAVTALAGAFAQACGAALETVWPDAPRSIDDDVPAGLGGRDFDLVVLEKPRVTEPGALRSRIGEILAATAGDVVLMDASAPATLVELATASARSRGAASDPIARNDSARRDSP